MPNRPPSDEIPALDELASKIPSTKPAAPSPAPAPASEMAPSAPARAPTTLGALEVKIELGSGEEVPTGEFQAALSPEEAKPTGLYAPAVSTLIDRLEEPEVAVAVDPNLAKLRLHLPHLLAIQADLKAHLDPEDGLRASILKKAEAAVAESHALIESLARPDPGEAGEDTSGEADAGPGELEVAREALLEASLGLQRVIASCPAPAEPLPAEPAPAREHREHREATAPAPKRERVSAIEEDEQRGRRRLVMLGVLVGLLALGRVALLLQDGKRVASALEEREEPGRVQTTNRSAGATADQLAAGIPSVLEVRLEQLEDGSLKARAAAIDPDGDRVTITYRWLENDQQVELEGRGALVAYRVRPGGKYRVEARASDGKRESDPVLSPALVARAAGSGRTP